MPTWVVQVRRFEGAILVHVRHVFGCPTVRMVEPELVYCLRHGVETGAIAVRDPVHQVDETIFHQSSRIYPCVADSPFAGGICVEVGGLSLGVSYVAAPILPVARGGTRPRLSVLPLRHGLALP